MALVPVGLGEVAVSGEAGDVLVAYALGSCVGVALHDPIAGLCGLAHVVVPGEPPRGASSKVAFHAPTGVQHLVSAMRRMGGTGPLQAAIVGGASVVHSITVDIGRRNVMSVRKALWAHGLVPLAADVGGTESRTVYLDVPAGTVRIRNGSRGAWVLEQEQR